MALISQHSVENVLKLAYKLSLEKDNRITLHPPFLTSSEKIAHVQ